MNKYLLLISLMIFIFAGCKQQISGQDFEKILADSKNHSAVSYWYAGEKGGYHYIQERWPFSSKTKMFQISQDQIKIFKTLEFTEDQSAWINLKYDDVVIIMK